VDVWWLEERGAHTKEWMNKTQKFIDRALFIKQSWCEVLIQHMLKHYL
jgi:hypothetical protein